MLTRKEFDILTTLEHEKKVLSQRELARLTGYSVGTVNSSYASLVERGLICDDKISDAGLMELEPYRVKRAVFIAAGFGSRLVPITLNTPKPLVRVHGKRIIDSLLDAVHAAEIEDVIIVRGYLAEQFEQLLHKYPKIKFIENPAYNEANNISSAMCARYFLQNSYVLEADIYLQNPSLIKKYQYTSMYYGVKCKKTDDWFLRVEKNRIVGCGIGGENCYQMVGISYWNEDDGKKMIDRIQKVFESPGGKERYWDQVALQYFVDDFHIEVTECKFEDYKEIDTFNELKAIDRIYDV